MLASLDSHQQRLRLSDLGHLGRRQKVFERRREDGVGFAGPARRQIELGESKRRAKSAVRDQWVVALRPSSRPAAARMNAPEQTLATRPAFAAAAATLATSAGSCEPPRVPSPPASISVS